MFLTKYSNQKIHHLPPTLYRLIVQQFMNSMNDGNMMCQVVAALALRCSSGWRDRTALLMMPF